MKRQLISYLLAAAAAAAVLIACTREPETQPEVYDQETEYDVVLTATIAANDPATRGVTVSPEAITCTWSEGDLVDLVYQGTVITQLSVASISGNSAQLVGKVWGAYPSGTQMTLYYGGHDYDYSGQNGTKASAEARAYLKADITTVTQANKILTLSSVGLKHQQAYFELSFRDGPDQLKIKSVEVTGLDVSIIKSKTIGPNGSTTHYTGTDHFTVTADGDEGLSTVYFVISDDGEYPTTPTYTFKITDIANNTYTKEYKLDGNNDVITPDLAKSLKIENGTYHSGEWILDRQTPVVTAPVAQYVIWDGVSHELVTPGQLTYGGQPAEGAVMEYYAHREDLNTVVDTAAFSPFNPSATVTWSTDVPTATEPGEFYVWYRIKGGVNFDDVDPLPAVRESPATTMPAVIDKRTLDVTAPVGVAGLTYTGSAQALVLPGSLKDHLSEEFNPGLEIKYYVQYVAPAGPAPTAPTGAEDTGWSAEIPYGTNAGNYYVYYKVDGGAHYHDVAVTLVVVPSLSTNYVPIAQADAVIANPVPIEGLVYNGIEQQLVLPADASDGCKVYYLVTTDGTLVPTAESAASTTPYSTGWVLPAATLPAAQRAPKEKNAGTYYVWTKVVDESGDPNMNYSGITGISAAAVVAQIAQADITVTEPTPKVVENWTFDNTQHALTTPAVGVTFISSSTNTDALIEEIPAKLYYQVNSAAWTLYNPGTPNLPEAINAGSYTVKYKVEGGQNFKSKSETLLGTVTVSQANPFTPPTGVTFTPATAQSNWTYDTTTKALLTSGATMTGENCTVDYKVTNDSTKPDVTSDGWSTSIPTASGAGSYYVWTRVTCSGTPDNYLDAVYDTPAVVAVEKATPSATVAANSPLTYNESPQALVTCSNVTPTCSVQYKVTTTNSDTAPTDGTWETDIPQRTNAATYYVWYKIVGNSNYYDVDPVKITVSVAKADPIVNSLPGAATSLVYDGNEKVLLTSAPSVTGGTSSLKAYTTDTPPAYNDGGAGTWTGGASYTSVKATAAGTYYVWLQITGDDNHNNIVYDTPVEVVIASSVPSGAIDGLFTINAGGTQVYFSQGNLQATYDGSSWSWAFASNQEDYIGNAAANTSIDGNGTVSTNGTVDLFGWVGASCAWVNDAANHGISNSTNDVEYGENSSESLKSDWGNTIGTGWRTLTRSEWDYIFSTRNTGGTVGTSPSTTTQARYTLAMINIGKYTPDKGIILFPDGVDFAASEFTDLGPVNATSDWSTRCSSEQWAALAAKGCVFLPAAGSRSGVVVSDPNSSGSYWSSSGGTSNVIPFSLRFDKNNAPIASNTLYRRTGCSVRLVINK